ncbi:hypothetical protein [Streptomyces sp. DW26H14]|uniref:hypothetical protein n=1 Tax=Streptomyces sp. DW26H14 TaxID=3435395 RepID=UPI00403DA1C5
MTVLRPETAVVSQLLCDLPDAPADQQQRYGAALVRAPRLHDPDPDFAASVAAGHVETPDAWAARVLGHTHRRPQGGLNRA